MAEWDMKGNDCSAEAANACIVRGGDPTLNNGNFADGNACQGDTMVYTSDVAKGISDAGETGFCTMTVKLDNSCKVNGLSSAQELNIARQVRKTNSAYLEEVQQDVIFSRACPPGTFVQSEIRIV